MDSEAKVRENRLRRAAARRGFALAKNRHRDALAIGYGTWTLTDNTTGAAQDGLTLGQVEELLEGPR